MRGNGIRQNKTKTIWWYLLFIFSYLALGCSDTVEQPELNWAKQTRGEFRAHGSHLEALPDGGYLVAAGIDGNTIFGPDEANQTAFADIAADDHTFQEQILARYNTDGSLLWAHRACKGCLLTNGLTVFNDGSSLLTGIYTETVWFDAGGANETELSYSADFFRHLFAAKFTAQGSLIWVQRVELPHRSDHASTFITGTAALPDGSFYLAGIDGIAKYDPDGTEAWQQFTGGQIQRMTATAEGSVFVSGRIDRPTTFGPDEANETTITPEWPQDALFVARYTHDGSLAWVKQAASSDSYLMTHDIFVTKDSALLLSGSFIEQTTVAPGEANETALETPPSAGSVPVESGFLAAYTQEGQLEWAQITGKIDCTCSPLRVAGLSAEQGYLVWSCRAYSYLGNCLPSGAPAGLYAQIFERENGRLAYIRRLDGSRATPPTDPGLPALSVPQRSNTMVGDTELGLDGSLIIVGSFGKSLLLGAHSAVQTELSSTHRDLFLASYSN